LVKRWLTYLLYGIAGSMIVLASAAGTLKFAGMPHYQPGSATLAVPISEDRIAHGRRLVSQMCTGCHLNKETRTLAGHAIEDVPAMFGRFASANITRDPVHGIGGWTDEQIVYLFRTGVRRDGRMAAVMPVFPGLSDDDLASIIAFLRSADPMTRPTPVPSAPPDPSPIGIAFARFVLKPHALPGRRIESPAPADRVAFGRYLALRRLDCYGCHSADFVSNDIDSPERSRGFFGGGNQLRGAGGVPIYSANLTPDPATGIGRWSERDFTRALRQGLRPDNTPIRSPMELMPEITDEEAAAIYAYLRTVPAIVKPRRTAPAAVGAASASGAVSQGRGVFAKYCVGCHGPDGRQTFDITRTASDLRTDDQLAAWIRQPGRFRPGAKMPAWEGILSDEEIRAVAAYVKTLGEMGSDPIGGRANTERQDRD
jgi:mono/diheme cytochrome c family protein